MIIKKISVWLCAVTLQVAMAPAFADESDDVRQRSWYLGVGFGITELDPDTNNTGYNVADERDTGLKLFGGYDYSERLTIEGFYTDLGSAQLSSPFVSLPDGAVDYTTIGASALWYFIRNGEDKGKNMRKGLQVYAHGGLSFLSNSSSISFSQNNSVQVQYGAGVEYGLNNGIAFRAGIDLYDKDAGIVFVGVMKRFGTKTRRKIISEPPPEPVVEAVPEPEVIVPVVVVVLDTDKDGVLDPDDQCADSPANIRVDEKGCSIIAVEIEGVNFESKSFDLTEESKRILDEAVVVIKANPELQIEVQAHTDYKGPGKVNLKLSEQRALSVKIYLVSKGVDENQLVAKGYGESQPIADNKTEEGRAKNRRVELKVIKDEVIEIENEQVEADDGAQIEQELSDSLKGLETAVEQSAEKGKAELEDEQPVTETLNESNNEPLEPE